MQETSNSSRPVRLAPAVFLASLSLAFIAGGVIGLAPEFLGWFGKFVFYGIFIPLNLCIIIYGVYVAIRASAITGLSSGKDNKSFVLSPEDLARWRSIKPGMDRHEVTAILGQPDGPPVVVVTRVPRFFDCDDDLDGKILYEWGGGRIFFEPNSGPVFHVKIPEYV
jgi:hypothetical protein